MGNVFGKAFRILVEQDVRGNFRSMLHGFLPFLSGFLDRIMPILVWFETCASWQAKLSLTVKTGDVTSGRRDMDPQGRLRATQGQMG